MTITNKKDIISLLSLIVIQGSNALLPLVIFPYILLKVGAKLYSQIAVTEAASLIVLTIVIYSFEIDGVSRIAGLHLEKDINEISQVFSKVFYSRILLFFICLLCISILILFLEKSFLLLILIWMLIPISYIIQSYWLFQGLEYNLPAAVFTSISKLASFGLIVTIIQAPNNYFLAPLIIGLCNFLGAICSFYYIYKKMNIKLKKIALSDLKNTFYEGKEIFLSNISVIAYRDLNVVILSIVLKNETAISIYSMSEKFVKAFQAIARPFNQLYFPKLVSKMKDYTNPSKEAFDIILRIALKPIFFLIVLILAIIFSYWIINETNLFKLFNNYLYSKEIFYLFILMSISVLFGVSNFLFGTVGLNYLGEKKYLLKSMIIVGISSLVFCTLLVFLFNEFGAAINFVLSEILLFILIYKRYNNTDKPKDFHYK